MEKIRENFGIKSKFVIFETDDRFEPYKKHTTFLGSSDIAQLTMLGFKEGEGAVPQSLRFGGDGDYKAYIVDNKSVIPSYYTEVAEFKYWLKIFDDKELVFDCDSRVKSTIKIFRAGDYGVIIYIGE